MRQPNPFPLSDTNKRYQTYDYAMRQRFGGKVARVCLDAGMTCPNLDGSKGRGGCVYCSPTGSGDFAGDPSISIGMQLRNGIGSIKHKWSVRGFIAYFQAHTNTYASAQTLRALYEEALSAEDVVGLAVATRPDCLPDEVCEVLKEFSKRTYLTVELGLQTIHNQTGVLINRCHTMEEFLQGYEKLQKIGVHIGVHLINGLPGETREMMIASARKIGQIHPHLVKLHLLYVAQGTLLAQWYRQGKVSAMSREEYVKTVCDQLEVLPAQTILGRLTGDGAPEALIAPEWSRKKLCVLNEIDKELFRRDSWQGKSQ